MSEIAVISIFWPAVEIRNRNRKNRAIALHSGFARIAMPISCTTTQSIGHFESSHCLESLVTCESQFESQIAIAIKSRNWEHSNLLNHCYRWRNRAQLSEEDKRATTNVQNGLVFFFLFSFIIFSYLWTKTAVKPLNSKKSRGGKILKNSEQVWKCVENCQKVWKSAETILPFSCWPLVFLWN